MCLQKGLGAYSFIIFACICLATLIYIWVVIPETKNKTFLETSKLFAQRNKVDIGVEGEDFEIKETGEESKAQEIKNTFMWMGRGSFTQDTFLRLSAVLWKKLFLYTDNMTIPCQDFWTQKRVLFIALCICVNDK